MGTVQAKVVLVKATDQAEELISSAGKLCYARDSRRIFRADSKDPGEFVQKLMQMGHESPIEHVVFTFYIEGVSRAMTHQLVRHRLASYSQRSQRYVDHDCFDYVVPPRLKGKTVEIEGEQIDAVAYFEQTMDLIAERYARLKDALGLKGEKSNEDARYVLPNACETKILMTMNARELLHFFEERLCVRAQWEIRGVAEEMLRLVKEVCPSVFAKSGPKCVRLGGCPEGTGSCGNYDGVRRKYDPEYERENKRGSVELTAK
ncbi:FAD-dependent thymidylate synthase [Planctomycetota bacterium]